MTADVAIPTLRTERLILRAPRGADAAAHAAFYATERAIFVGGPLEAEIAWRALAAEAGHWLLRGYGRWIVEDAASGETLGLVGPWFPEGWPEPEIGWTLFAGEGAGVAFEAAEAARAHVYGTLGWTTAISLIDPLNARSLALAGRLGATFDGLFDHVRFGRMAVYRHPDPAASPSTPETAS